MAGKRHHHIWQMLQRGFSWREYDDDHVWVYSKDAEPKRTVTRKFGRLTGFYGPEGSEADENITEFENSIQEFVQAARKSPHDSKLDNEVSAALVAHLEMRSLFLRSEMSNIVDRFASLLGSALRKKETSSQIIKAFIKNNPQMVDEQLEKLGVAEVDRIALREIILLSLPGLADQASDDLSSMGQAMSDLLKAAIPKVAADAHNKALVSDFRESQRTVQHKALRYTVYRSDTEGLILPDTCVAFISDTGCTPVTSNSHKVEFAIVPLSKDAAIIGQSSGGFRRDERTIQRILASCSYQNFLAHRLADDLTRLRSKIGSNAKLVSDRELKKVLNEQNFLSQ